MPDPRAALAVATSKALTTGIRLAGRGGGTALPGLVAGYLDPNLLDKLARRLPAGTIVVAGTNGKTTTSRMLAAMLTAAGRRIVHNRAGSNLVRGISAAFAEQMSLFGPGEAEIGVIESDENAFPDVVRRVQPRLVVLLNLFRDQLDRYGELETVAEHWRPAIAALPPETTIVVNADDPNLAALVRETRAKVVTFGLEIEGHRLPDLPHASDAAVCRTCETRFVYDALYLSHLGNYRCPNCGARRPRLHMAVDELHLDAEQLRMVVRDERPGNHARDLAIQANMPGLYNAYNALAAVAAAKVLGVRDDAIVRALGEYKAAFGRLERVAYRDRHLTLALAKNPVGFNEVLRMLTSSGTPLTTPLAIGINDLDADGRDVSWLWDVDFEVLADPRHTARVFALGIRGHDMAVRLKYAGVADDRLVPVLAGMPLDAALERIVEITEPGDRIFVLLTYTAMLQLRQALADRGAVAEFWEQ
jgi:UDP-N-acetylmuramyl tripeptide synthase